MYRLMPIHSPKTFVPQGFSSIRGYDVALDYNR